MLTKINEFQKTVLFFVCVLFLGSNANATKKEPFTKLKEAVIESKNAGTCRLRTQQPVSIKGVAIKTVKEESPAGITFLHTFDVKAGGVYIVREI